MNWYYFLKTSDVWKIPTDGSFASEVSRIYELEYKRSMLKNNPFKGMDQRKQNILNQIEIQLQEAISEVKSPLQLTLQRWLESHAITNPSGWAAARVEDAAKSRSNPIEDALSEYAGYVQLKRQRGMSDNDLALQEILSKADQRPQDFPNLTRLTEYYVPDRRMMMNEELEKEGILEFNERYNKSFVEMQDAEMWIEHISAEEIGISLSDYIQDTESLINISDEMGLELEVAHDLFHGATFTAWYDHWGPDGIDETRETVEKTYQLLLSAKTLDQQIAAVNAALNCSHQTGSMLDYLQSYGEVYEGSDDLENLLQSLTDGVNNENWENSMRSIGVQVPKRQIPTESPSPTNLQPQLQNGKSSGEFPKRENQQ